MHPKRESFIGNLLINKPLQFQIYELILNSVFQIKIVFYIEIYFV